MGIEVFHSEHTAEQERFYHHYCKNLSLAFTGGSDFHTANQNKSEVGRPKVPYGAVESLKEKLGIISQQTLPL
jgi:hypothetical protein